MVQAIRTCRPITSTLLTILVSQVSAKFCNGGHVCSPPKECCSLGCCYMYSQSKTPLTEMFAILIWTYWYLWAVILAGLTLAALCGFWMWQRRRDDSLDSSTASARVSSTLRYAPPNYSRCSSFVQAALPPPYNEVTAKPDLYPLVIGFDGGIGKAPSGFVMRYFRTLSHASTLDSLSSSFMCNVVNEANTIIPPSYSCNNSIDELSVMECDGVEVTDGGGSILSLANNRTTSDISSLAAQSPCSPPRATSPTIELRELFDKIQQLPNENTDGRGGGSSGDFSFQNRSSKLNNNTFSINSTMQQCPSSPNECATSRMRRARGKMYMPLGQPITRNKTRRWLSRSAPTTPSGTIPMTLLPGQSISTSETDNNQQHTVLLLSEQDENDNDNVRCRVSLLSKHDEEESQQL